MNTENFVGLQKNIQIINLHDSGKWPIILLRMAPNNRSNYNLFQIWRMLWDQEMGFRLFTRKSCPQSDKLGSKVDRLLCRQIDPTHDMINVSTHIYLWELPALLSYRWHPLLVRNIQRAIRRYAVRKESVRSTQKSCFIVRRHKFLL